MSAGSHDQTNETGNIRGELNARLSDDIDL